MEQLSNAFAFHQKIVLSSRRVPGPQTVTQIYGTRLRVKFHTSHTSHASGAHGLPVPRCPPVAMRLSAVSSNQHGRGLMTGCGAITIKITRVGSTISKCCSEADVTGQVHDGLAVTLEELTA